MRANPQRARAVAVSTAHILSAFGYEFLTFVMTVHVYALTHQAVDVGVFMAVSLVPRLFSSLYGSLTDRFARNRLFFVCSLAVALAALALSRTNGLGWFYALWFAISVLAQFISNLRSAIMTDVMPEGNFVRVNALMLIFLNVARLAAPLIGGIAATWWSAAAVLWLAAAVYGAAALAGVAIALPVPQQYAHVRAGLLSQMRDGMALIARSPELLTLGGISFVWRLCLGFQAGLLLVYVSEVLHKGGLEFGLLSAALAVGSILGGFTGPRLVKHLPPQGVIMAGVLAHFTLIGALGLISSFPLALADAVAANFVIYAAAVAVHSARDSATPADYRGRVYGSVSTITTPAALVSMLAGGWLADAVGIRAVFMGGALLALAGVSAVFAMSPMMRGATAGGFVPGRARPRASDPS